MKTFSLLVPKTLLLLLLSLLWGASVKSQCYIQLGEYSGFDTSPYFEGLDAVACDLVRSLPPEFQNQFRVYDFGFYSLNEYMAGGVDQIWQDAIRQAEQRTPYYLIFGKESNIGGIYSTI